MKKSNGTPTLRLVADASKANVTQVSLSVGDVLTIREAARLANRSPDTISNWCRDYGIGRQLKPGVPWRVSGPALRMVLACDLEALEVFRERGFENSVVRPYLRGEGEQR